MRNVPCVVIFKSLAKRKNCQSIVISFYHNIGCKNIKCDDSQSVIVELRRTCSSNWSGQIEPLAPPSENKSKPK